MLRRPPRLTRSATLFPYTTLSDLLGRLAVHLAVAVDVVPGIEVPAVARLQGEPQVLVDREALEEIGDLERAREPAPGYAVGRQADDVAAVQLPRDPVRQIEPGNQGEGGGLVGAVAADERMHLCACLRQVDSLHVADDAEALLHTGDPQSLNL